MYRLRFTVAALVLLPTVAFAQKKGMGSKDANWDAVASKAPLAGPTISAKDFEEATPFKFILDKKKDLKLTDAQITTFKASEAALKESNKQRFGTLDSLRKEARPKTSGTPSAEEEARMAIAKDALQGLVREVQSSYDDAAKLALPMLDEPQRPEAQKAIDKYHSEMSDMLREKMGSGRGGPGAGGGGGRGRGRGGV